MSSSVTMPGSYPVWRSGSRLVHGLLLVAVAATGTLFAAQAPELPLLAGQVVDPAGAGVAGIEIRASDESTGLVLIGRTGADGRFRLGGRSAGRFVVTATGPGFLPARYGAVSPGQPGVPVRVGNGVRAVDLQIVIEQPGAIHGRVTGADDAPVPGAVHAMATRWNGSRESLLRVATATTASDGRYALTGLVPDTYIVLAVPVGSVPFGPTFHPGARGAAQAAQVVITAGRDVHGVDISVDQSPVTEVSVRLHGGGGTLVYPSLVIIPEEIGDTALRADTSPTDRPLGSQQVGAGRYTVIGTALEVTSSSTLERRWATRSVDVDGRQPVDLVLDVGPGASIEGRVVLDGGVTATVEPPDNWLWPWDDDRPLGLLPFTGVLASGAGGTFAITGIAPGRYVLQFGRNAAAEPSGWSLASVLFGGQDVVDLPIELHAGDRHTDVEIVLTSQGTELAGTLTDAAGRPRFDVTLVAFAVDSRYWWTGTRRIRLARPDTAGYYRMRGLPAGEYFLVAVSGAIPVEPAEPQWLGSLTAGALTVELLPGGQVVQDLKTPGVFLTGQKDAGGLFSCQLPIPEVDEAGEHAQRGDRDQ
ncbi:MAG TPA: carboxypeptidase-like regulatory domain-containing protein [Vicinamibacterales bacterium]|nr:carboxypeptidase-like regulatory domain-containing protein [Vicinamibacterales bacterium]